MPTPLDQAVEALKKAVEKIPEGIADLFALARPTNPSSPPPSRPKLGAGDVRGALGALFEGGGGGGLNVVRMLVPQLARFEKGLEGVVSLFEEVGRLRSSFLSGGMPRLTPLQFLGAKYGPMLGDIMKRMGPVLPAGMTWQGFLTRAMAAQGTNLFRHLTGLGGHVLGMPGVQSFLGPQVTANLGAQLGRLNAHLGSRSFQTNFGVTVGQHVAASFGWVKRAFGMPTAAPGKFNWVAVGSALAKGVTAVGLTVDLSLRAVRALSGFAEGVNARNAHLMPFSGQIAFSQSQLQVGDFFRTMSLARRTEGTAAALARDIGTMHDGFREWNVAAGNLSNLLASLAAGTLGRMAKNQEFIPAWFNRQVEGNPRLEATMKELSMVLGDALSGIPGMLHLGQVWANRVVDILNKQFGFKINPPFANPDPNAPPIDGVGRLAWHEFGRQMALNRNVPPLVRPVPNLRM